MSSRKFSSPTLEKFRAQKAERECFGTEDQKLYLHPLPNGNYQWERELNGAAFWKTIEQAQLFNREFLHGRAIIEKLSMEQLEWILRPMKEKTTLVGKTNYMMH